MMEVSLALYHVRVCHFNGIFRWSACCFCSEILRKYFYMLTLTLISQKMNIITHIRILFDK